MRTTLASTCWALFAISPAFAVTVSFHGVGDLSGGAFESTATAVSADGRVVVGWSNTSADPTVGEAFRWEEGVMTSLGTLNPGYPYSDSYATAVSVDGSVIVGTSNSEPFRWQGGVMQGLGFLPGESPNASVAEGVSGDGSVVVGWTLIGANGSPMAFRWQNNQMTALPTAGVATSGYAFAVSANGSVIAGGGDGDPQAYLWNGSGAHGLGFLGGSPPVMFSYATGITPDGSIVVGASTTDAAQPTEDQVPVEACLWNNGQVIGLGDLAGGEYSSVAHDISANGSIVVGQSRIGAGDTAFIWDHAHGIRSLLDVLADDYGLDMTGWRLTNAAGISDDGLVLVGTGINPDGNYEGWVARLPEPASLLLLLSGAALVLRVKPNRI